MKKALLRTLLSFVCLLLAYACAAVVLGMVPVNRDFKQSEQGIDIYLYANAVHADLIVPVQSELRDWRSRLPDIGQADYLAIGWGDRAFYLETKEWAALKPGNALRAIVGLDGTLMHVESMGRPLESKDAIRLRISPAQYTRLLGAIDAGFAHGADGKAIVIPGAHYNERDAFYEAQGRYSLFSTCNDWVRATLAQAGIRTAAWAPFSLALTYQASQAQK